ncbi:DNA/RNA non-specific endonuclease [Bengtsoniella intestinalis]|uniref:DNA/RNA non-specific endonuclease n=1 Tax=Bengtsoniella intestinalis TaxID=3073143 RepID=UPI00391F67EE
MKLIDSKIKFITLIISLSFLLTACSEDVISSVQSQLQTAMTNAVEETMDECPYSNFIDLEAESAFSTIDNTIVVASFDLDNIPIYTDNPYVIINDNVPFFDDMELTTSSFEQYAPLDSLERCGIAVANVGIDLMPTDDRESISVIYPTGWVQAQYDIVSGGYLYNRSHIIGFQLTGENANKENLITGTRQMNVDVMLPFENLVAEYVKETENHVYFRVTPIFEGDNLLATGVLMEGQSVEDDGEGMLFNVFCYNAQAGVTIDYATGESWLTQEGETTGTVTIDATAYEDDITIVTLGEDTDKTPLESIIDIDTNGNGIVTIAEAEAAGYQMPITSTHWLYAYMRDADGDGVIGE